MMTGLYKYFKPTKPSSGSQLPEPDGHLSITVPSTSIVAANQEVSKVLATEKSASGSSGSKQRGTYAKYTPKQKATIGNYSILHGTSAALRYFKAEFPDLKWSTVNDWKVAIIRKKRVADVQNDKPVVELVEKKRGRPSTLPEEISREVMEYIRAIRDGGGVVNTSIVIAAALGMVKRRQPSLLECNGGYVTLKKSWAKYLLGKMNYVKRRATTKHKVTVSNFEQVKQEFLMNIKAVATFEEVPNDLIINWDQTGIKYVPVSEWTMAEYKSKRVEVSGIEDKRQITATFAASLTGTFLPVQLVYQGKTSKCHPSIDFPDNWHITHSPNHWCNESTMISYVQLVIVPYVQETRKNLGLPDSQSALVILDEFKGQTTHAVLNLLKQNNIEYVIVPPNCTDRLQPLDVSINKPAKDFLRKQFQSWYAEQIVSQKNDGQTVQPVDMRLSIVKPIGAKWMIAMSDYIKSHPEMIINGFKNVGIVDFLKR